ncbi:CHAT domain [Catenibacterium mitsuokai]|nr:CHAT domain [Catenibacterium mitsuokai]
MHHPDTLDALNDLTQVYDVLGNYDQVLEIAEHIYEIYKETLGDKHPETLLSLSHLSIYYSRKGNYIDALKISRIAYDAMNEEMGKTHPYTIHTLEALATYYYNLGDYKRALESEKEVYNANKEFYGEYNEKTIVSLSNLSDCYHRVKNYHQAIALGKSAYEKAKQKLGDNNFLTLIFLSNLAMQYSSINNYDQAIELGTTAYQTQKEVLGENNPYTINTLSDLCYYYTEIGNSRKAIELGTLAYERSKEVLGESHPSTLKYLYRLILDLYVTNASNQTMRKYLMEYYENIKDIKVTAFNINDISSRRNYLEYFNGAYRLLKSCVLIDPFDKLIEYLFINKNLFFEIDINRFNNKVLDDRTSLEEVTHTIGNNFIIDFYELENTGYGLILIKEGNYSYHVVDYADIINGTFMNNEGIHSFIGSLVDYEHIYICPDGKLYNLSFERILNNFNISYLSSVQTLYQDSTTEDNNNQLVSFVYPDFSGTQSGDNDRGDTKGVLYGSYLEGMFIHDIYGEKSTIYSSYQVSHDNFLKTRRPRILHVSTHGDYLDNENMEPMDRGILCLSGYNVEDNNSGYISAKEIQYMDLRGTKLVVLSACNTGLGENISGEGIYGIRRAFELAGCQTLLLTVEEVDDYNSAIFMKSFYERYNQTNNIYQSFKETKEYLKQHGLIELKRLRDVFEKEMKNKIKNPFIYRRNLNELNKRIEKSETLGQIVRKKNGDYVVEDWNGFIIQGQIN